jgi:hypothetical protein
MLTWARLMNGERLDEISAGTVSGPDGLTARKGCRRSRVDKGFKCVLMSESVVSVGVTYPGRLKNCHP